MHPEIQIFVGEAPPLPQQVEPIQNRDDGAFKPDGGLWTSSYNGDPDSLSAWVEWMRAEQWSPYTIDAKAYALKPRDGVRVYTIDSATAARSLPRRSPVGVKAYIDYEAAFNDLDIDAIRLTAEGQRITRFGGPVELSGWDCESILWSGWHFDRVEYIGEVEV